MKFKLITKIKQNIKISNKKKIKISACPCNICIIEMRVNKVKTQLFK